MGVVQDWITFELGLRIRSVRFEFENGPNHTAPRLPPSLKKCLNFGQWAVCVFTVLLFAALSTLMILSAHKDGNNGYAFNYNYYRIYEILGYMFLSQFLLMTSLTIYLLLEIKSYIKIINSRSGRPQPRLRREMRTIISIFACFALSYTGRFFFNVT